MYIGAVATSCMALSLLIGVWSIVQGVFPAFVLSIFHPDVRFTGGALVYMLSQVHVTETASPA